MKTRHFSFTAGITAEWRAAGIAALVAEMAELRRRKARAATLMARRDYRQARRARSWENSRKRNFYEVQA